MPRKDSKLPSQREGEGWCHGKPKMKITGSHNNSNTNNIDNSENVSSKMEKVCFFSQENGLNG